MENCGSDSWRWFYNVSPISADKTKGWSFLDAGVAWLVDVMANFGQWYMIPVAIPSGFHWEGPG